MGNPTREQGLSPGFVEYVEQYHCPRCEGAIAAECVQGSTVRGEADLRTRRVIRVYCSHCDALYEARLLLVGGGRYEVEQAPAVVPNDAVRRSFFRKLEALHGDRVLGGAR